MNAENREDSMIWILMISLSTNDVVALTVSHISQMASHSYCTVQELSQPDGEGNERRTLA